MTYEIKIVKACNFFFEITKSFYIPGGLNFGKIILLMNFTFAFNFFFTTVILFEWSNYDKYLNK